MKRCLLWVLGAFTASVWAACNCGHGSDAGCVNLECQQVTCPDGGTTTLTGTVYDPSGQVPLYNALVYVPNGQTQPFTPGVTCDRCGAVTSGSPLVITLTRPDGTFSLRLSYGAVDGWTDRGQTTSPFTTLAGLYGRATGQPPYDLDARWIAAKGKLTPGIIFDFTTNNDIVGGNSGSPVLNANAEVIGVAFDGNIHSIGGDYWFDPVLNRTVAVSAAATTEALRTVYGAKALLAELGVH